MATLAERDESGTFSAQEGELCELTDRRTRAAKVFELPPAEDGRRRYRVGAGIGPVHYPSDPFADAPDWHEIDLSLSQVNDGTCDWQLTAAGYGVRLWQERSGLPYAAEFSRGGATYTMAPISLSWQDGEGNEEVIAHPAAGISPVIDDDAYTITWPDAFGAGLGYGYNCCPDILFKVLTIRDRQSLPAPQAIDGARLVLRLWVNWGGDGAPGGNLPRSPGEYEAAEAEADAISRRRNAYAHKRQDGAPCFWVQPPEAWDSGDGEEQQRWPLDWWYERRGQEVTLCLALDATALDTATYPLLMDTAIAEEVVGAGTDDAEFVWTVYGSPGRNSVSTGYMYMCQRSYDNARVGFRWKTVPIPTGVSIESASFAISVYLANYDDANFNVHCEAADDAATFSTTNHPASRTLTTASTPWVAQGIGTGFKTSPDISSAVQEVVDRPGWVQNNSVVVITDQLSNDYALWCNSYDRGASYGAKFNATYTEGAGAGNPHYYYAMMRGQ